MSPNDNSGANANSFDVGSDDDLSKNSNLISQQQKLFLAYYGMSRFWWTCPLTSARYNVQKNREAQFE